MATRSAASAESLFDDLHAKHDHAAHRVVAEVGLTPTSGRVMLVDSFTVTSADTLANQEAYPQNPAENKGVNFVTTEKQTV